MEEKTGDYYKKKIGNAVTEFSLSRLSTNKRIKAYHDTVREVVTEILEIPFEKRTYELNMTLVNGCHIINDKTTALITLIDIKEDGRDDPMWYHNMGLCFHGKGKIDKETVALKYFNKFMEYEEIIARGVNGKDMIANMQFIIKMLNK